MTRRVHVLLQQHLSPAVGETVCALAALWYIYIARTPGKAFNNNSRAVIVVVVLVVLGLYY